MAKKLVALKLTLDEAVLLYDMLDSNPKVYLGGTPDDVKAELADIKAKIQAHFPAPLDHPSRTY